MHLNDLHFTRGAKRPRKRVGCGAGSGSGKTAGRGHKGQQSRAGGGVRKGFEGGQMPLHRRLPKFGYYSYKSHFSAAVRLDQLEKVTISPIDIHILKKELKLPKRIARVKIIGSGAITKPFVIKNVHVTSGARAAIEAVGGSIIS